MSDITVARRYAAALYEEAQSRQLTEQVDADVDLLGQTFADSREVRLVFSSPVISPEKKKRVLRGLFKDKVQQVSMQFMELLVNKGREDVFQAVVTAYGALRDAERGIVEAHARVAREMNAAQQQALQASLEQKTGKQVRLHVVHDPELLGGLVVRIGDTVYDGSARNQLANLRERMERGTFATN